MSNLLEIDIKDLIPQKEPFVMVEQLLHCDWERTKTSLSIKDDNIFVENGAFSQSGIIENIAQTCAARLGYLNRNHPVKIGMIGSIDDFEFSRVLPKVWQEIITEIVVEAEIGQVVLLNAKVLCGEQKASGKMKVVLTDTEI
jgi:predicted hotdog family 3-hydroxylacyl-ACP dehydratase